MNIVISKERQQFYKTLLHIALPITIQNLIMSSLNMVDTVMIGQLGGTEIASVGLANQLFFLLNLLLFGVSSGSAILTAQFWGKKDILNIRKVLGICLLTGGGGAILFSFGAYFIPEQILSIFSKDLSVVQLGSAYLKIIAFSYLITAISFSYSFILRSTGNTKLPMYISAVALAINTFLNYLLIFGHWGLPKMGVEGAALATVIARFIECALLLFISYSSKTVVAASFKEMFSFSKDFLKHFFEITTPVILNEFMWALGVTIYAVVYAQMGTSVITAINITQTTERIAMVVFFGMGNACAVMLGNEIGANNENTAYEYAKRFALLGPILAVFIGLTVVFSSKWVLSFYNISPLVYDNAHKMLIIFSIFLSAKVFNLISIIGVLRSGGDTKFSLLMDIGGVWFIGIPMAVIGGWLLHLPVYWVYALVSLEEVLKLFFGIPRLYSKKWLNNVVAEL